MRSRYAASQGPFIKDDPFAGRSAHDMVERVTPVIELLGAVKQKVLRDRQMAESGSDASQLLPAWAMNRVGLGLDNEEVRVGIGTGHAAGARAKENHPQRMGGLNSGFDQGLDFGSDRRIGGTWIHKACMT